MTTFGFATNSTGIDRTIPKKIKGFKTFTKGNRPVLLAFFKWNPLIGRFERWGDSHIHDWGPEGVGPPGAPYTQGSDSSHSRLLFNYKPPSPGFPGGSQAATQDPDDFSWEAWMAAAAAAAEGGQTPGTKPPVVGGPGGPGGPPVFPPVDDVEFPVTDYMRPSAIVDPQTGLYTVEDPDTGGGRNDAGRTSAGPMQPFLDRLDLGPRIYEDDDESPWWAPDNYTLIMNGYVNGPHQGDLWADDTGTGSGGGPGPPGSGGGPGGPGGGGPGGGGPGGPGDDTYAIHSSTLTTIGAEWTWGEADQHGIMVGYCIPDSLPSPYTTIGQIRYRHRGDLWGGFTPIYGVGAYVQLVDDTQDLFDITDNPHEGDLMGLGDTTDLAPYIEIGAQWDTAVDIVDTEFTIQMMTESGDVQATWGLTAGF